MPLLQVRDCPEDVYEALRERAKRENRSIAQQTITILQEHLGLREPSAKPAMPAQPSRPLYGDKPDDVDYLAKHA
ncbi:MAG: hypothetical protein IJJ14_00555, partial [Coriobacteriales bacterium]|nr:hypothetical protein [Coriobacteriales bacterium]